MRLKQIGWWCLLPALLVLPPVGCDHDGTLGEVEPEPIVVRLVPAQLLYREGDTVVANVWIAKAENVGSVPFHILYDKDVLQFLPPAIEGPFMGDDGTDTVFLAPDTGGGGELVVGIARLGGGAGAHGSGLLATFKFVVINPGSSEFAFTGASVKDPQARNLPATYSVVQLRVHS